PKRVAPERLRRIRNILENPRVALVIDRYSDDWSELAYLLIQGTATLLPPGDADRAAAGDRDPAGEGGGVAQLVATSAIRLSASTSLLLRRKRGAESS